MGVYIDMEMPDNCDKCKIRYGMFCPVLNRFIDDEGRRHNCPLAEIPEPHGDLIGRDAARGSIKPWSPEDERNGCTFDTVKN